MAGVQRRTDTRAKIQTVALELFAEQGYDKTSLREIAERLGVTKAALYYHFKTKEDIVLSLFDDFRAHVDEIIEWGDAQEKTEDLRKEVLRRYAAVLEGPGEAMIHFVQGNQSTMREFRDQTHMLERFRRLANLITSGERSLRDELTAAVALFTLHIGLVAPFDLSGTPAERKAVALDLAFDLVSSLPTGRP